MLHYQIVPVTPFQQNCTVLWCDRSNNASIVDPGGDLALLMEALEKRQLKAEQILLTHGHIDHAGGAAELAERLGIPILGPHKADTFWIEAMREQGRMFAFEQDCHSFTPKRWLNQGDTVQVGDESLEVLHTPGHTPGHVCFFHAPSRLALVGDVLFKGSIGRTDFPGGNYEELIHSIKYRLWPLGSDVRFIPGHGEMSDFASERRDNPFVQD